MEYTTPYDDYNYRCRIHGSALAWPLRDNGHTVHLVGTHLDEDIIEACKQRGVHPKLKRTLPEGVQVYPFSRIDEGLEGAEVIVNGVSSFGIPWITEILPLRVRTGQKNPQCNKKGLESRRMEPFGLFLRL